MPLTITDYHKIIRDAVTATVNAQAFGVPVVPIEDLDAMQIVTSFPAIGCACVGPEQNRPEMTTNRQDGLGYSVAVMLLTSGVVGGVKAPEITDLTFFRRSIRSLFNNARLYDGSTPPVMVSQVGWCEVSDSGPLVDKQSPSWQKIATALIVTAIGRFPRV